MIKRGLFILFIYLGFLVNPVSVNAEEGLIKPQKGTVYYALLEGLKLLAAGDIEGWISSYCDGIRLCSNAPDINNIRQYRAKLQEKIASSCLKNGDTGLEIGCDCQSENL